MSESSTWPGMQFGVFSVSDITRNPVTGETPSEARADRGDRGRSRSTTEEVGLDVFAFGEHHNPPFCSSVADDAARATSPRRPSG